MTTIQEEPMTAVDNFWEMFMDGAIKFCEFYDAEKLLYEKYEEPMVFLRRGVKQGIAHG
jgi:hypothetical protein